MCTRGDIFPSISQLKPFSALALPRCNHRELFQGQSGICQQREPSHCWLGDGGTLQSFSAAANIALLCPALESQHTQITCDTLRHPNAFRVGAECANIPFSGVCTSDKSIPHAQISPLQKSICISLGHIPADPTYCSTGISAKTP